MALIDDPKAFIARMFQMEANEGRGTYCQVFSEGTTAVPIDLQPHDRVYAIYKSKYYFTSDAMYVSGSQGSLRLAWKEVSACSSKHGDGSKKSTISTVHGKSIVIDMTDLAKGWSGRISQLVHSMIDRWGSPGALGLPLMTVQEFLCHPDAEAAFAPNFEGRLSCSELSEAFQLLLGLPGVESVFLSRAGTEEEELAIQGVIIVSTCEPDEFAAFISRLSASEVVPADESVRRKVGRLAADQKVFEVMWS
ncbi:hypothetical protein [Acidovorax sp. 62]|uniref:hypothetical protein n=1 Tax=Acidovorax sp. 62 TaxID=2035203 RepID=UPI000C19AEE9|nr:hypothetical protein [Acidovorax sp. 62]